jgi:hypothetical protein
LGYGDALPSEVEVPYHGPTTALRISIDWEDRECNGSDHLNYGNGSEVVIHAGYAGVGEGKVKGPGYYAGVGAGDPRAALRLMSTETRLRLLSFISPIFRLRAWRTRLDKEFGNLSKALAAGGLEAVGSGFEVAETICVEPAASPLRPAPGP